MKTDDIIRYYHQGITDRGGCGGPIMGYMIVLAVVLMLCGCKTQYVTVPEIHTEYKVRTDTFIQRDSIHVSDSVTIREKGDTVWVERWRTSWRDRWRDRIVCDTVIMVDSVAVPYPVDRKLTWWQQAKVDFAGYFLSFIVVILVLVIVKQRVLRR